MNYFFELELYSIYILNYSETYFKLDSEEATHCHLICCVYIKGLVNTKDQSNACMCEMMSKGSKEALTVLIVTHVEGVERSLNSFNCYSHQGVERSLNSFTHNFLSIQPIFNPKKVFEKVFPPYHPMLCMLKGSKVIFTFFGLKIS